MMKKILIWILSIIALIVLVPALYITIVISFAGSNPPELNGEITVPGIQDNIRIIRDQYGNPHLEATTETDLYFAQGFAHAQDRFWQMALTRQLVVGRLSEWIGTMGLRTDRSQRMYGFQQKSELAYKALPDDEKAILDAYSAGVNAWLTSEYYAKPPEMRILHIEPEVWRPWDSFVVNYGMSRRMGTNGSELERARVKHRGLPDSVLEIITSNPTMAIPIIANDNNDEVIQTSATSKKQSFSNAWTLSGEHTASGLPLVANDPQLTTTLPNNWHLQGHNLNGRLMAGGTMAGMPGIIVGHNGKLAWTATNSRIDIADATFLENHPDDPSQYRRGPTSEWQTFEKRPEKIVVRFGEDFDEPVLLTDRGFAFPNGWFYSSFPDLDDSVIAEATTAPFATIGKGPISIVKLNRASTVEEGINSLKGLKSITLSISMADTLGNIGFVATGAIPKRPEAHASQMGFYPEDDNQWEILPFEENPKMMNPPNGRIVTANQIIDPNFPHYLSDYWASHYRANRIHEALDQTEKHDVDSFLKMQMDSLSPVARDLVTFMKTTKAADEKDAALVAVLEDWNFHFDLDSPAATISMTWAKHLHNALFADETGNLAPASSGAYFYPMKRALNGEKSEWCDDINTEPAETCADLLTRSLTSTRMELEEVLGEDMQQWQWGKVAKFRHAHVGLDTLPILGNIFSRNEAHPAGPGAMFTSGLRLNEAPYFTTSGSTSSYQGIYDLSDLNNSLFMLSGGASGHYKSENYDNLTALWLEGKRIKMFDNLDDTASSVFVIKAE